MEKKKRFRKKIGMVFRIDLKDGTYGYGQVATDVDNIFFNHKDEAGHFTLIEEILKKPIAFYATVDHYVLKDGLWEILGIYPVKPEHQVFPEPFSYNPFKKTYTLFKNGIGNVPCTLEETYGHECLSSWEHGAIEQRLRDHFAGRPCYFVEQDRSEHLGHPFMSIKDFYKQYNYDFHWLDEEENLREKIYNITKSNHSFCKLSDLENSFSKDVIEVRRDTTPKRNPLTGDYIIINCYAYALGFEHSDKYIDMFYEEKKKTPERFGARPDFVSYLIKKEYLKETEDPAKNCLVLYFDDKKNPQHAGIIEKAGKNDSDRIIRSRWGNLQAVIAHKLWYVPINYGTGVKYYQPLKTEESERYYCEFLKTIKGVLLKN